MSCDDEYRLASSASPAHCSLLATQDSCLASEAEMAFFPMDDEDCMSVEVAADSGGEVAPQKRRCSCDGEDRSRKLKRTTTCDVLGTRVVLRRAHFIELASPMEVEARAEVGTPPPRCFKPSLEELRLLKEPPAEGRPAIRLTRCSEPPTPPTPPSPPPPPPAPPAVLAAARYAPLEPIKRRDSSQI